ncbi:hypothetical protein JAAARDRAFT_651069 [Jaapia argillacea MUCL 33604]|uniref:Uncharacterized protein n=1 Tax=Jaapia argillacea MUCL 33604 TaxID=933084 RepID=A0A067PYS8_9AGAM|nr:hypothetical protein JAAARDRAFT_651069 [Jaapia argillacea MUCL 33604]
MDGVVVGNDDEDPSDSEAADAPLNSAYLSQFKSHLSDFQAHLLGIVKGQPLPPSYFPPTGYWTSAEKDSFFHLLCIHSRFRPDLIAAGLKSKTVADVCAYLELLEVAAAGTADDDEEDDVGQRLTRDTMDATMEMSEDWIDFEETQSQMIINLEPTWDRSTLQTSRSDELKAKQSEVRAKRGKGRTEEGERDRAGEKKRKREWMEWSNERKEKWAGEDAFRVLDVTALKVLGHILRKDEEARYLVEQDEERIEGLSIPQVQDHPGPSTLSQPTRDGNHRPTTPPSPRPSSPHGPHSPTTQTQPQPNPVHPPPPPTPPTSQLSPQHPDVATKNVSTCVANALKPPVDKLIPASSVSKQVDAERVTKVTHHRLRKSINSSFPNLRRLLGKVVMIRMMIRLERERKRGRLKKWH